MNSEFRVQSSEFRVQSFGIQKFNDLSRENDNNCGFRNYILHKNAEMQKYRNT